MKILKDRNGVELHNPAYFLCDDISGAAELVENAEEIDCQLYITRLDYIKFPDGTVKALDKALYSALSCEEATQTELCIRMSKYSEYCSDGIDFDINTLDCTSKCAVINGIDLNDCVDIDIDSTVPIFVNGSVYCNDFYCNADIDVAGNFDANNVSVANLKVHGDIKLSDSLEASGAVEADNINVFGGIVAGESVKANNIYAMINIIAPTVEAETITTADIEAENIIGKLTIADED